MIVSVSLNQLTCTCTGHVCSSMYTLDLALLLHYCGNKLTIPQGIQ